MTKTKDPIRLRQRRLKSGFTSLYLDIYLNGNRSYEYMNLYLIPEKNRNDKQKNRETLLLAESIRAKRLVELRNGEYGFNNADARKIRFFDFYERTMKERNKTRANYMAWQATLAFLHRYERRENITLADITERWVLGFRTFLENAKAFANDSRKKIEHNKLSRNSCAVYFDKLRACINSAYRLRLIKDNPLLNVEALHTEDGTRMYLTIDEIKKLAQVECQNDRHDTIKRAFLFSCLTGLRRSDIERLQWKDIHTQGEFTRILFRQRKTNEQEYLDISADATLLMRDRQSDNSLVFDIPTAYSTNRTLQQLIDRADIHKRITFHCGRHTFATMMLDLGVDIYTVSKLLGHTNVKTTQIYAKVIDKNKQEAVSRIPRLF